MSMLSCDEDLLRRLPLPLAQLDRRAHNAKNPLDRLLAAYYLWEASLKLLGSVAIIAYAERGEHDPKLAERLQNLARPSVGHWWEFVRSLLPVLAADDTVAEFRSASDLILGRARADLPRAAGLDAVFRDELEGSPGARATVRLSELFERTIRFRNRVFGHGAAGQHAASYYDRIGLALLSAMVELLGRLDPLTGGRLVYVSDVRRVASGRWLVERTELIGESARRIDSLDWPADSAHRLPQPEQIYLQRSDSQLSSLHPLLLFEPETSEVLWLNSRRDRKRTEYLSYSSGRVLERKELITEQRALLARVLGVELDTSAAEAWAARSLAEEPETEPEELTSQGSRTLGEFELISELGRGGMGVVYRAWQRSLGRQVAIKCLLRSGDAKAEARFNREIQALGRVEHPHLAKIFTSGSEGDQWFYAMELIEGATLSALGEMLTRRGSSASDLNLEAWRQGVSSACDEARKSERPLSADDSEAAAAARRSPSTAASDQPSHQSYVRQAVKLVRQVAEAAHALHEAGIIHRDIKPGNIMVSADGNEAILMDLGLAQLADDAEGRLTRTQQFVGTLRYASPEQIMAVGQLTRRSDVYSLGATLWEVITLQPLFGATDDTPPPQLIHAIQFHEPERPRKYHAGIASDLEAIVLKCLEKNPGKRYGSAKELADDLNRWLNGELVTAQPLTFSYAASKFVRRHRIALTAASLVLVAAIGGTAFSFYQIQKALAEAKRERKRAEDNLAQARKAVDDSFVQISENTLLNAPGMEPLRAELLRSALAYYREFTRQHAGDAALQAELAQAYSRLGLIRAGSSDRGAEREALEQFQKALAIQRALLAQHPGNPDIEHDLAHSLSDLGNTYADLGNNPQAESAYREGLRLREKLVERFPQNVEYQRDLASSQHNLGYLHATLGRSAEAEAAYLAGLKIRRGLVHEQPESVKDQDELAKSLNNLGMYRRAQGQYKQALEVTEEAIKIRDKLVREHPEVVLYRARLAASYEGLANILRPYGRVRDAEKAHQDSIAQWEALVREHPTVATYQNSLGEAYGNLGNLYRDNGQSTEAESAFQKAHEVFDRLAAAHPEISRYRVNVAEVHHSLGNLFKASARINEAKAEYDQALAAWKTLVEKEPGTPEYQSGMASVYDSLGQLQAMAHEQGKAEQSYKQAAELFKQLADRDPSSAIRARDRALNLVHQAELYQNTGNDSLARDAFQQAVSVYERLVREHPDVPDYQDDLASGHNRLGKWFASHDEPARALECYERAVELWAPLAKSHPEALRFALNLGTVFNNMGTIALAQNEPDRALAEFARAIRAVAVPVPDGPLKVFQRQKLGNAHLGRARALGAQGKFADAISEAKQATEFADEAARVEIAVEQAIWQARLGQHAEAAKEARAASQGKTLTGASLYNLACALGLAAGAAQKDPGLSSDERTQLANNYAAEAVALLTRARAEGFFAAPANARLLQDDTDLAALRDRADFRALADAAAKPPDPSPRTP